MAFVAPPPLELNLDVDLLKHIPTVKTAEVQPDSDSEVSIEPVKNVHILPVKGDFHTLPVEDNVHTLPIDEKVILPSQPIDNLSMAQNDDVVTDIGRVKPGHPYGYARGGVIDNVKAHVGCNSLFVGNVHQLVAEFEKLKTTNKTQARTIGNLKREKDDLELKIRLVEGERDQWKLDYEHERVQHGKTRATLHALMIELNDLRNRYDIVIGNLKRVSSELNEAKIEINRLNVELKNRNACIVDLEEKLKISNASEDATNTRITRLQDYIYNLEREKAAIEKEKDMAQFDYRDLERTERNLKKQISELLLKIRNLERRRYMSSEGHGTGSLEEEDPEATLVERNLPIYGIAAQAPALVPVIGEPLVEAQDVPATPVAKETSDEAQGAPATPDPLFEALAEDNSGIAPALAEQ